MYKELTIRIPVRLTIGSDNLTSRDFGEIEQKLQQRIKQYMRVYNDGRYNFPAELIYDGAARMSESIIKRIIGEYIQATRPDLNRLVPTGPRSSANGIWIETDKLIADLRVSAMEQE